MRAPVQKTRPRRTGKQTAPAGSGEETPNTPVGKGRPTHVRNRLIVAVAVVAAAIAGAGAPSVVAASGQLSDSQDLVTLAEQTQDALTLAHSLADERDEVTSYVAAGRPEAKAPSEQRGARVDRQVEELRADPDTPASLRADLDGIATVRRAALTGKSTALEAHQAYSAAINELHRLAEQLAERMPPRAGSSAYALAELDSAVQQAASARGLLLAALGVPRGTRTVIDPVTGLPVTASSDADAKQRDALTAAARQAHVRSAAALADFHATAPKSARASYDSTITGPEVNSADKYLADLTDEPTLSDAELATSTKKLDAALSARVDLMRGVESALYEKRTKDLAQLRDDDVTALEIRIALLGALMLLTIGIATGMARTLTRPLSVLRRGSARLAQAEDPAAEEPVAFTGRNDEFAQAVRSVNALHARAVALAERVTTLEADRKHLVGQRQKMADAREELRAELAASAAQLDVVRKSIGGTFVNLALRTLGLVERQLSVIESLEEREQDPERLSTLFKLDHFATVMRRHSENLLVLAGTEHVHHSSSPVPLVDVVRAAVSEIERYERVRIAALPPHAHVAGFAADDLSHLLAELMENATSFSPPDLPVEVSGWLLENGEVMLSVQDEGIGMTDERMERLNSRLADFDPEAPYDHEDDDGLGLGLYVVARLAHRHGARVQLREQKQGGVAAVVVLPKGLLAAPGAPKLSTPAGGSHPVALPGADAEANSNTIPGRLVGGDGDPLVALAERAVERSEAATRQRAEQDAGQDADAEAAGADRTPPAPAPGGTPARDESEDGPDAHAGDPVPESPAETTMELLLPEVQTVTPAAPTTTGTGTSDAVSPGTEAAPRPDGEAPAAAFVPGQTRTEPPAAPAATPDPYAIGPDTHERASDQGEESEERVTEKGLPKRTPKISAPAAAPRPRTGTVDADALRRRLGGFRQGAEAGRRDVEAEIAEQTTHTKAPMAGTTSEPAESEVANGGTVEEASS
ncbi:nitrate- and nitrite sensing domain-containing protein [Streptomyces sp. DH24]|uniref:sensor histidine kinase n=1 Tax=Streptomyces sp. DH24 TaxID=3040123 RepID=UPI002442E127|nr:nitrate- and nitrite sensing domain-containing protein [Streptomyces sp. DH24]MDG9716544.1 nitrate- and nitrite sensing domain-containing protein [Streptomyces sp. DH24]